jgi:ABC-2 type transport system ATP-binding protein
MYGIRKAEARQRADAAVEAFQLTEFADRHCRTYSGGQRRRLDIALGCVHLPKVLFLDEPTANLDPPSRQRVWEEVRRLRADGVTVFLTTHYLEEADALCDRIAIIDYGRLVAEGTPTDLKREISGDVVMLGLNGSTGDAAEALKGRSYVLKLDVQDDDGLRLYVDAGETAIPQIMRELAGAGIVLETITLHRPSLDDVFLTKTGRTLSQ